MSQQLYVMTPGNAQPQLLTVDEVAEKIKAGALPATVSCARLGESTWTAAKELPEVGKLLEGSGATPPPLMATRLSSSPIPMVMPTAAPVAGNDATTGVPPTVATPSPLLGTPAPTGSVGSGGGGADKAKALLETAKRTFDTARQSQTAVVGAGAGAGLLLLGIILLMWYRNSYSRGLVLEHVPEDCAVLGYVDIAGIATSDPVKSNYDKLLKSAKDTRDETLEKESKKIKERTDQAIHALDKQGIDERSVREVAMCVPTVEDDDGKSTSARPDEKGLILIGGTFRRGDVLKGIQEALEAGFNKEDLCKIDDDDGMKLMTCSFEVAFIKKVKFYAALVDGRVLAISPDKKILKTVKSAKDRAKTYGADKGEHVVVTTSEDAAGYDGSYSTIKLKIGSSDTVLTIDTRFDKKKGESKLAKLKDSDAYEKRKREHFKTAAKECFEKSPVDMLADAVEGAEVEAGDDGVKYSVKVSNKDLAKAIKAIADADKDELKKIGDAPSCVMRIVDPYVE
ncbi:MAG: hypothetical protein ACHREM_20465 [Polyangiales bacterium]